MPTLRRCTALIILIVFLSSCSNYDFSKKFSTLPDNPKAGDEVEILFNPSETPLNEAESISAIVYSYDADVKSAVEYKMTRSGEGWVFSLITDRESYGMIIKFTEGEREENNDNKGFIIKFTDNEGKELPEAQAGLAVAYATWGPTAGLEREREKAFEIFTSVFEASPEIKTPYLKTYFYTVERTRPNEYNDIVANELGLISSKEDLTPEDLYLLTTYYGKIDDQEKSDQYGAMLETKFPQSEQYQKYLVERITSEEDIAAQIEYLKEFEAKYPESKYLRDIYDEVGFGLRREGKFKELAEFLKSNPGAPSLYIFYYAANSMMSGEFDNEIILEVAKLGMERGIREIEAPTSEKPSSMTNSEWVEETKYYAGLNFFTYGKILTQNEQPQVALAHLKSAVDYTTDYYNNSEINNLYIKCLIEVGEAETATKLVEEFISNGKSDSEMKSLLKELYTQNRGSEEGFEEYLAVFEEAAQGELLSKLKKELISKPAPDFTLLDLDGREVTLSDLKGKTIIIDFWATWCGPCRRSFPGMKMAVEKYADNENIKFFFVNTWERVENKVENASNYIKNNNYPFRVLMDEENKVVGDYKVSGIPTKFVIDKDQNIRFMSVGVNGSAEYIAEEIDVMISLVN